MTTSDRIDPAEKRFPWGFLALLLVLVFVDAWSCAARGRRVGAPVPEPAILAFERARQAYRASGSGDLEALARAESEARSALALDPDWVPPARLLDDIARERLLASEVLESRLAWQDEVAPDAGSSKGRAAIGLYLVGRLRARESAELFAAAKNLDPGLAWAHHGEAWTLFTAGRVRAAYAPEERARQRARGAHEVAYFTRALARFDLALGRHERASERLEALLFAETDGVAELSELDRLETAVLLARAEISAEGDRDRVERGLERALTLLERDDLIEAEVLELAGLVRGRDEVLKDRDLSLELEVALAEGEGPAHARLRADLAAERGAWPLAVALADEELEQSVATASGLERRLRRIAAGRVRAALETWSASLPGVALAEDGLPREPALRAIAVLVPFADGAEHRSALGEAFLAAGWFHEARALAEVLALENAEAAFELDASAGSGLKLLAAIERSLVRVDAGASSVGAWRQSTSSPFELERPTHAGAEEGVRRIQKLDDLLAILQGHFDRYRRGAAADLLASPRLEFGPAGSVVHPGPAFSADDEEEGRGKRGERVEGLAAELASIGRFGIFGQALGGGGPDGTVLRRLWVEERAGEHLGAPFSGTVAWCDGADVPSRPERRGARIIGAALHEGYWVDVQGVREELEAYRRLEHDAFTTGKIPVADVLASRGPRRADGEHTDARWTPRDGLGAARKIRLAFLAERTTTPRIGLDELVEATALHEEGHLCDRRRFLPLSQHLGRALALFAGLGFSPARLARRLEYRAQLTALCVAPEPRIHLADCASALDRGDSGVTPHGAAYRELLRDLLQTIDGELEAYPSLDPDHYLVYQLHHLSKAEIRRAALALARSQGLIER